MEVKIIITMDGSANRSSLPVVKWSDNWIFKKKLSSVVLMVTEESITGFDWNVYKTIQLFLLSSSALRIL